MNSTIDNNENHIFINIKHKLTNSCNFCGKKYTRKSSYDKHVLLCEVFNKSKREKKLEEEEELKELPSQKQLYKIIEELAFKYQKMEEKMTEMQKWVQKNKKKINILDWLNENATTNIKFNDVANTFVMTDKYIEDMIENNFMHTISMVFQENLLLTSHKSTTTDNNNSQPIYCFVQKINTFYATVEEEIEGQIQKKWKELDKTEIIRFFNIVHHKLTTCLRQWKLKHEEKINNNDKWCEIYNKTIIKLMSISFKDETTFNKVKTILYNHLKIDLKNLIEYEFVF